MNADHSSTYCDMCCAESAEKKVRRSVLCVRTNINKRLDFKLERVTKMCVDGAVNIGGNNLHITRSYIAPEGSKNWDEVFLGAEAWEDRFVVGAWNWRGTKDMMEVLEGERSKELRKLPESEKVSKERMSQRDIKIWRNWPRSQTTASARAKTPLTTRSWWGDGSRTRLDHYHGPG